MKARLRIRPSDQSKPDLISEWFDPKEQIYDITFGPAKESYIAVKIIIELMDESGKITSPDNLVIPL